MSAMIRQVAIRNVSRGENVLIYEPVNLYDCELADEVFVGPFVEIQGIAALAKAAKFSPTALSVNT